MQNYFPQKQNVANVLHCIVFEKPKEKRAVLKEEKEALGSPVRCT